MQKRDWTQAKLAHRAGVSSSQVSRILASEPAGAAFCRGTAEAFGFPPGKILRMSGIAPSFPVTDARLNQLMEWMILLDEEELDRIYGDVQRLVFCRKMDYEVERLGR